MVDDRRCLARRDPAAARDVQRERNQAHGVVSGVNDVNIDLLKQQQVRARPCPASTLRSPPL